MSSQSRLKQVYHFLAHNKHIEDEPVWIPSIWNECGYSEVLDTKDGEIKVQFQPFMLHHLQYVFDLSSHYYYTENKNLDDSVIYSALVRYSAAWDYLHDGEIQSGTFLRFMILLPLLKKMGVNILYLLPVTRYSNLHLKGDIGSPYAVQSLFELDDQLHDPLLNDMVGFTIHDELTALVEACHLLDIKVVVDFIPRVTARNSEFIKEYPDWVYWIWNDALEGFAPPNIPELGFFEECRPDKLETVYRSVETSSFLKKFAQPPNELNPVLWQRLKLRSEQTGEELLQLVEAEMGITTAPAHSDWINDVQPIWTDITFYRLYKDFSPQVRSYLQEGQPPYVLFDTIKCNLYPGDEPNQELWDKLIEAIIFNLDTYRIDGFRIDIGHVLPVPLLEEMFKKIKEIRPQAILISEDLFNRNHHKAVKTGYNVMLGSGWNVMTDISINTLMMYVKELPELQIHVFACSETADTPRIMSRGGTSLARMMSVFNHFLPNAIPYLTTGIEVNEIQPLNCGLGDNTGGAEIPRAFFNKLKLNWSNPKPMIPLLQQLNLCKKEHLNLVQPSHFFLPDHQNDVLIYAYLKGNELLIGCFNLNDEKPQSVNTDSIFPVVGGFDVLIDSEDRSDDLKKNLKQFVMQPNQAMILYHDRINQLKVGSA